MRCARPFCTGPLQLLCSHGISQSELLQHAAYWRVRPAGYGRIRPVVREIARVNSYGHQQWPPRPLQCSVCSASLHFVGLALSACLFASSPRPSCTADSSAALRATAPVRSLVHAWPCYAPLQPLLPLPVPAPPLLVIFCAHLSLHHSLSCPISHFPPRFPI
jgi:hypothetical protein